MDSVLVAAAEALAVFDPLEALRGVALRNDATALALRGVAMAQLGEFARARKLLAEAARGFGGAAPAERARCIAAEAEIALSCRDLAAAKRGLDTALRLLEGAGDWENALFVRLQIVRRLVLLGDLHGAARALRRLPLKRAPARLVALAALAEADIAVRWFRSTEARAALGRAMSAARAARIPSLVADVERAARDLDAPVARLATANGERPVALADVEELIRSRALTVDGCRREVRSARTVVSLASRPVLFALARALAEAAPAAANRESLIRAAFGGKTASESLRARLRVELGRLRRMLADLAEVRATNEGFRIAARDGGPVRVLLPPEPGDASALLGLLRGSESWSTSALAEAMGQSQRTVQRALGALLEEGRVHAVGHGRARRWVAPPPSGFATTLLLAARAERS
ncbi:MAG TPA: helix-turn-helix domain-containing protein [Polyangiaceae bacterium]|nr:helix-turn-helix domain-containing protein [Polyangiaceae bacterium]